MKALIGLSGRLLAVVALSLSVPLSAQQDTEKRDALIAFLKQATAPKKY